MKELKADFLQIWREEHGVLIMMVLNFLAAVAFVIFFVVSLNLDSSVMKIGYGDIGGYRDGGVVDILAFPILAVIFGVLHNLLAARVFHKKGSGMTKFFLFVTTILILGTFLVLMRLLGEG